MILAAGVYLAIIFQCFSKIGWLFKFYQWCGKSFGASVTTKEMLPSCCYGSQANESESLVRLRIGCVAFCALSSLTLLAAMSLLSLPLVLSPAWKHTCPDFMIATADTVLWKSCKSYKIHSKVKRGDIFLASSAPKVVDGFCMVPVVGGGAIETSFVRAARAADFQSETAVSLSPPSVARGPGCIPWTSDLRCVSSLAVPTPKMCLSHKPDVPMQDLNSDGFWVTWLLFALWSVAHVLMDDFYGLWHVHAPWLPIAACIWSLSETDRAWLRTLSRCNLLRSSFASLWRSAELLVQLLWHVWFVSRRRRNQLLHALLGNTMFTAAPLPSVGFVNAGAKTCHLGAALHVLFQVKPFVDALHALPLPASCACACCLLLETHKDVLRGEKGVSVQRWRQWFKMFKSSW